MGYGKSAIISHLICAPNTSNAYKIRTRLIAYHLCRNDVLITLKPELFIKRMVGLIASRVPEFRLLMSKQKQQIDLQMEKCSDDVSYCIDRLLFEPMNSLNSEMFGIDPYIILIDALDECDEFKFGQQSILDLLIAKLVYIPPWIKFIVTSRNTAKIRSDLSTFHKIELRDKDDKNKGDLKSFIWSMLRENFALTQKTEKYYTSIANLLVENSKGNFLYVKEAIKFWFHDDETSFNSPPETLQGIFENNFKRVFGNTGDGFRKARPLFEIIIASQCVLSKDKLFKVYASFYKECDWYEFDALYSKCSYFLTENNGQVLILHTPLYRWLKHNSREHTLFRIDIKNGHRILANYWMTKVIEDNGPISFQSMKQIAYYVVRGKSEGLVREFINLPCVYNLGTMDREHVLVSAANFFETFDNYVQVEFPKQSQHDKNDAEHKAFDEDDDDDDDMEDDEDEKEEARNEVEIYHLLLQFIGHKLPHGLVNASDIKRQLDHAILLLNILENFHNDVVYPVRNCSRITSLSSSVKFSELEIKHLIAEGVNAKSLLCRAIEDDDDLSELVQCPKSYNDVFCLRYFGSKGDKFLISLLLKEEVYDKCVIHDNYEMSLFSPILIEISSRGYLDMVKFIISYMNDTFTCTDKHGASALIHAATYNRVHTTLFLYELFREHNASMKCNNTHHGRRVICESNYEHGLFNYPHETILPCTCLCGVAIQHLVVLNNHTNMAMHLDTVGVTWNISDCDGLQPIHYAAALNRVRLLRFLVGKVSMHSETNCGATPLHIAAQFAADRAFAFLYRNLDRDLSQMLDKHMRTVLHYPFLKRVSYYNKLSRLMRWRYGPETRKLFTEEDVIAVAQFILSKSPELLTKRDVFDRTCLHYAVRNGHYQFVTYLVQNYSETVKHLLKGDTNHPLPLRYALRFLQNTSHERKFTLPSPRCHFLELFDSNVCDQLAGIETKLSKTELSIMRVVELAIIPLQLTDLILNEICDVIASNSVYLVSGWVYHIDKLGLLPGLNVTHGLGLFGREENLKQRIHILKLLMQTCSESPSSISLLRVMISDGPTSCSLKDGNVLGLDEAYFTKDFVLSASVNQSKLRLNQLESQIVVNTSWLRQGYSKLEIMTLQLFRGFSNLIDLYFYDGDRDVTFRGVYKCDASAKGFYDLNVAAVSRNNLNSNINVHCNASLFKLGLAHILAVNGLVKSIDLVINKLGPTFLYCNAFNFISPLYLATKFNEKAVVSYFKSKGLRVIPPVAEVELLLMMTLSSNSSGFVSYFGYINCLNKGPYYKFTDLCKVERCLKSVGMNRLFKENITNVSITRAFRVVHQLIKAHTILKRMETTKLNSTIRFTDEFGQHFKDSEFSVQKSTFSTHHRTCFATHVLVDYLPVCTQNRFRRILSRTEDSNFNLLERFLLYERRKLIEEFNAWRKEITCRILKTINRNVLKNSYIPPTIQLHFHNKCAVTSKAVHMFQAGLFKHLEILEHTNSYRKLFYGKCNIRFLS